jgi:hypothetical protein
MPLGTVFSAITSTAGLDDASFLTASAATTEQAKRR